MDTDGNFKYWGLTGILKPEITLAEARARRERQEGRVKFKFAESLTNDATLDWPAAMDYYLRAATQGYWWGLKRLSEICLTGRPGVEKNTDKGIFLLETLTQLHSSGSDWESFENRDAIRAAYYTLFTVYEKGEIVPRDGNKADEYLTLARDSGDNDAQYESAKRCESSDPREALRLYRAIADSTRYMIKSAEHDPAIYANAAFNLASMYAEGRGTRRDYRSALQYYQMAEKEGHPEAAEKRTALEERPKGWLSFLARGGVVANPPLESFLA